MNYKETLDYILNTYDAFSIQNTYGINSHKEEFELLEEKYKDNAELLSIIKFIKLNYVCYHKDKWEKSTKVKKLLREGKEINNYQEALDNIKNLTFVTYDEHGKKDGCGDLYDFYLKEEIDTLQKLVDKEIMIRLQLTNAKFMDDDGKLKILETIERIVYGESGKWK